jgi:CDP-glycerol glycerophosphotransferase
MNTKITIWRMLRPVARPVLKIGIVILFYLLRIFPIKKNKVIATAFGGIRYGDNQKPMLEALHEMCPETDIVWVKGRGYEYELPEWIRCIHFWTLRWFYEYATAKIWINNCLTPDYFRKRKGQLYIETWHGGLGIKKVFGDVQSEKDQKNKRLYERMANFADVLISNSDHLSAIYRDSLYYNGPIWKCGYPMNDILFTENPQITEKVKKTLNIPETNKIFLYAPTHRDKFVEEGCVDESVFFSSFTDLRQSLSQKFGGEWTILLRWHQGQMKMLSGTTIPSNVVNATSYPDMQELLMATDVMMSDYSSCIFDAAMRRVPCFIYASDYDEYKQYRGVYYEMEELPFPYAKNNDELEQNVRAFDMEDYLKKWDAFTVRMGLNETGHAAQDIAEKMADFINGKKVTWNNDYPISKKI